MGAEIGACRASTGPTDRPQPASIVHRRGSAGSYRAGSLSRSRISNAPMPAIICELIARFVPMGESMAQDDDPGCRQLPKRGPVRLRDLHALPGRDPPQQGHGRVGQVAGVGRIIPLPLDPIFGLAEQLFPPLPGPGGEAEALAVRLHDPGLDQFPIGGQSSLGRGQPQSLDAETEDGDGVLGQRDGLHSSFPPWRPSYCSDPGSPSRIGHRDSGQPITPFRPPRSTVPDPLSAPFPLCVALARGL